MYTMFEKPNMCTFLLVSMSPSASRMNAPFSASHSRHSFPSQAASSSSRPATKPVHSPATRRAFPAAFAFTR